MQSLTCELTGDGYEQATGLGLATAEYCGSCHLHGAVAGNRATDDRGDLIETERDHPPSQRSAAYRRHIENHIQSGNAATPSLEA
jgi:hypothetical protein